MAAGCFRPRTCAKRAPGAHSGGGADGGTCTEGMVDAAKQAVKEVLEGVRSHIQEEVWGCVLCVAFCMGRGDEWGRGSPRAVASLLLPAPCTCIAHLACSLIDCCRNK